jgi:hypothetical protein
MQSLWTPRARRRTRHAVIAAAAAAALIAPGAASAADRTATPTTFASVFAAAQPGDRVLLESGAYGQRSFTTDRSGFVTLRPAAGATVTLNPSVNGGSYVRFEGFSGPSALTSMYIGGDAHHVEAVDSRFTGSVAVRTYEMAPNTGIVFARNTHIGINPGNGYEGRITILDTAVNTGIVIRDSLFDGGTSDGVQDAANGVQILNNEFRNIIVSTATHSDAIQLYGSRNSVVKGNYIHGSDVSVMAPDGGQNNQILDNVFVGRGYRPAVQLGSQTNMLFAHNTVRGIDVKFDRKTNSSTNSTGVGRDNVLVNSTIQAPTTMCTNCQLVNNLASGAVLVGGASPTTYPGHVLAPGSPGTGDATDGGDRGVRLGTSSTPTPAPTPTPTPTPTPSPTDTPAQAIWTAPTGATVGSSVTLDGTTSKGDGPLTCTWSFENADGSTVWETVSGCKIAKTFANADTKYVRLTVRDADGDTHALRQSFAVGAPAPTPPADVAAQAIWTAPTGVRVGYTVTLDGTASKGDGPLSCTWSFENQDGSKVWERISGCKITKKFTSRGTKYVRLIVRDADGDTDSVKRSFSVTR